MIKNKVERPYIIFSDKENTIIRDNYSTMTNVELLNLLPGRNIIQLRNRVFLLGIVKNDNIGNKYSINIDFFKKPLSNDAAYILGYILTDGNIRIGTRNSRLNISSCDNQIIEDIKKAMGSTHKIYCKDRLTAYSKTTKKIYKARPCYELNICFKSICEDLFRLGITPKKSLTIECPVCINNKDLFRNFLRGVIDGDGSIILHKDGDRMIQRIEIISGSGKFLNKIADLVAKYVGVRRVNVNSHKKKYFVISYGHYDSITIGKFIYADINKIIYLKRKYEKIRKSLSDSE